MAGMDQTVINWLFVIASAGIGFFVRAVWEAVKELQRADKDLAQKVSNIEVLVAGAYVTREEHAGAMRALFAKLDRIEEKLGSKADK